MPDSFIGIDPGLSGGIAVIGSIMTKADRTPIIEGDKRTMNLPACAEWIRKVVAANGGGAFAVVELVHSMPGQGISSSFTFGKGLGSWHGILATLGIPYQEVSPVRWKKAMLPDMDKSQKGSSIIKATQLFPHINLIPEGCRVASDGMAEALLLADYGRRMYAPQNKAS